MYLSSDKSKTITDDRPFLETISLVIKGLTQSYFADMKKKGHYDTERKEPEDEDDIHDSEDNEKQDKIQFHNNNYCSLLYYLCNYNFIIGYHHTTTNASILQCI